MSCLPHRILTGFVLSGVLAFAQSPAQVVVGYYQESSAFPVSRLATNGSLARLTHLNYAFANIIRTQGGSYACTPFDPAGELGPSGVFQQLKALKQSNPNLKILISVGGATGSGFFREAAKDQYRATFVQTCISQFIAGNFASPAITGVFDGVDLDWEFPTNADTGNYTALLKEFRGQLTAYQQAHPGTQWLPLTSAIGPRNDGDPQKIQFDGPFGANQYVDFFNVMTYDYAGSWNDATTSTAPMPLIQGHIQALLGTGLPLNKMVLGIPFYGVHYTGNFQNDTTGSSLGTLLQDASKVPVLSDGSTVSTDYVELVKNNLTNSNSNVVVYHDVDSGAWAYDAVNKMLWSYDDERTIAAKAVYARNNGMAGIMTWDISKDTAAGTLLCAMETAAAGSTTSVCGSTPPSNPPVPTPGTLLFDFESGEQGWGRTGNVFSLYTSTDRVDAGAQSLSAHFITYRQSYQPHGTIFVTPPALVKPGSTVEFRIWIPQNAFSNLTALMPFFMNANWSWTDNAVKMSTLTGDAWNTVFLQVPANAVLPFNQVGIQFDSSRTWNGTIYIDSVKVR